LKKINRLLVKSFAFGPEFGPKCFSKFGLTYNFVWLAQVNNRKMKKYKKAQYINSLRSRNENFASIW